MIPQFLQKSTEWYTPIQYIDAAREVMGGTISLDPASSAHMNDVVGATRFYDEEHDGLLYPWEAERLWLNPPYCKRAGKSNQALWTSKLLAEYESKRVQQAILLVNASTDARWFQPLYLFPICFVKGRIHFNSPTVSTNIATVGSACIYLGANVQRFISVFSRFGVVVQRAVQEGT